MPTCVYCDRRLSDCRTDPCADPTGLTLCDPRDLPPGPWFATGPSFRSTMIVGMDGRVVCTIDTEHPSHEAIMCAVLNLQPGT